MQVWHRWNMFKCSQVIKIVYTANYMMTYYCFILSQQYSTMMQLYNKEIDEQCRIKSFSAIIVLKNSEILCESQLPGLR
jgi:hypothetical protein